MNDIETIKNAILVCNLKGSTDVVRVLDQSEFLGTPWGSACTLQVFIYETNQWTTCTVKGKTKYSVSHLYRFIRAELEYDGPVRLAVAS